MFHAPLPTLTAAAIFEAAARKGWRQLTTLGLQRGY